MKGPGRGIGQGSTPCADRRSLRSGLASAFSASYIDQFADGTIGVALRARWAAQAQAEKGSAGTTRR